jgi:hypothetical protein
MQAIPSIIIAMQALPLDKHPAVLVAPSAEPAEHALFIKVDPQEFSLEACQTLASIGYTVRLFNRTSREFAHVWKGPCQPPFDPRPNKVFMCQPLKRRFDQTFAAHPGDLAPVAQQLNKKVKLDNVRAGDDFNRDTRAMLEAIQKVPGFADNHMVCYLYMTIHPVPGGYDVRANLEDSHHVPFMHIDWAVAAKAMPADRHLVFDDDDASWAVVNSAQFREKRPEVHGGEIIGSAFGMIDTLEVKPCYFVSFGDFADDLYNVRRLIENFDVVFVKRDREFVLPDEFCCLYQWGEGDFNQEEFMRDADGAFTAHHDERFLIVLRKVAPCGYFE